jgi:hypothetical protein
MLDDLPHVVGEHLTVMRIGFQLPLHLETVLLGLSITAGTETFWSYVVSRRSLM